MISTLSGRIRGRLGRAVGAVLAVGLAATLSATLLAPPAAAAPGDPTESTSAASTSAAPTDGTVELTPGESANPYTEGALPEPDAGQRVTWAVQPGTADGPDGRVSFRHELSPGTSVTDYVTVTNYADHQVTFTLYASDGITTADGVFDLRPAVEAPSDGGSWVSLERPEVAIAAQQSVAVPFTITVPDDATPGDHPAGIVAALTTSAAADGAVSMERRVGARIHLRVPGEITPMIEVQNLSADFTGEWALTEGGTSTIQMDLVNTGNVRLGGTVTLEIAGPLGLWSRTVELGEIPEILPRNQVHVTATAADVPPLIMLTHSVQIRLASVGQDDLTDLPTPPAQYARASAMPWLWLIILLGVVGLIAYLVQSRGRARRQLAAALARAENAENAESADAGDVAAGQPAGVGAAIEGGLGAAPDAAGPRGGPVGPAPVDGGGRHR